MGSIDVSVDLEQDVTINTTHGVIGYAEIAGQIEKFYGGTVTKHVVWDFSTVEKMDLSADQIVNLAQLTSSFGHGIRTQGCNAMVVSKGLEHGLSRMYSAYTENERSEQSNAVFHSLSDALAWIRQQNIFQRSHGK